MKKCPYCDFNSHENDTDSLPEDEYIAALLDDLTHDLAYVQGRELASIFIGGGTPSLLSANAYQTLFCQFAAAPELCGRYRNYAGGQSGYSRAGQVCRLLRLGINRLSLGVQSFSASQLRKLGRIHDPADAERAIDYARNAGFQRLNIDIMYGLEDQTPEQALDDLNRAIHFAPEHISWYQLTVEPNTAFYKHPPPLPPEDILIAIQDAGLALLAANGYQRYEISAFARPGEASRHNINYWQFGDYLGIGAGAHGKLTQPGKGRILRLRKRKQPAHYLAAARHSHSQLDRNLLVRYPYLADAAPIEAAELPIEFPA